MARAGLRRGEVCGLRRGDVHLLPDSRALGCEVQRAHLHVARRENPNGAWAKSRRQRVVPLDFLVVRAFDGYEFERLGVARAAESDFVLVNLFREPVGAPMRPDAVNELMAAASRRAGLDRPVRPHQLRHAFGSNVADAGGGLDEIAELLGHVSMSSSQVYLVGCQKSASSCDLAICARPSTTAVVLDLGRGGVTWNGHRVIIRGLCGTKSILRWPRRPV
jgi:integrase